MQIKVHDFNFRCRPLPVAVYLLNGEEPYLLEQVASRIKADFKKKYHDIDEKIIDIDSASRWTLLADEANSMSLFAQQVLLDVRFDKKSLDAAAKTFFTDYLQTPNPDCLIILRAPNLTARQAQAYANHERICVVTIKSPNLPVVQQWIGSRFQEKHIPFNKQIPALISQMTQGNLLACAQTVDKILLTADASKPLTLEEVKAHLYNQSEYQLYELTDACLKGETTSALIILRQTLSQRQEAPLLLWLLAQEVRYLLHISTALKRGQTMQQALNPLKIWASKASMYQQAVKRHDQNGLQHLLLECAQLDHAVKQSVNFLQMQRRFEYLVIALATGKRFIA